MRILLVDLLKSVHLIKHSINSAAAYPQAPLQPTFTAALPFNAVSHLMSNVRQLQTTIFF